MEMQDLFLVSQDWLVDVHRAQAVRKAFSGAAIFRVNELMEIGCNSGMICPYFLYYFH